MKLCSSVKNPYPLEPWKVIGNSSGEGVLKVKILEAKYEDKLEFPGGRGVQNKNTFCGGSMGILWNCQLQNCLLLNLMLNNSDLS